MVSRLRFRHRHVYCPIIPGGDFPGVFMSVVHRCECGHETRKSIWVHT